MEEKYIELLLRRCVNFNKSKSLYVSYHLENESFIEKLVNRAHQLGVYDIYLQCEDVYKKHEILKNISIDEIDKHSFFNRQVMDEYALKNASFLILKSEYPGLMDDIDPAKLARAAYVERLSCQIFKQLQAQFKIPWCIAVLPSRRWAKNLFPNLNEEEAYNKLFKLICDMCMVNTDDPIASWNKFLNDSNAAMKKLNDLQITKMHYTNSLGTDLIIELAPNTIWSNACNLGHDMLANCPSYETFTTPNFMKTQGIVFASKPLCYNGRFIKDFYLEFKDGKVVNYDAKEGKELLGSIIKNDEYSCYLGEAAIVNHNSPISNTGIVYGNTLLDENSDSHGALGQGFAECIIGGEKMTPKELIEIGVNPSKEHVDFMIGTADLNIEAETNRGKVLIFKNGNLNL